MDLKSTFVKALNYYDASEFEEVILLLNGLLTRSADFQTFPWDKVYVLLGGANYELRNHSESIEAYGKALLINKDLEMASLGLYLNYVDLQKVDEAIAELARFLEEHKANLYLETLEELVEGLGHGYATKYEGIIRELARENAIPKDC